MKCGWNHTLLLVRQGSETIAYGCGSNQKGQLNIKYPYVSQFQIIMSNVDKIACGVWHSLFVSNGEVYGYGGPKCHKIAGRIDLHLKENESIIDIAAGHQHSCFLTNLGIIIMGNSKWGLGCDSFSYRTISSASICSISSGWHHIIYVQKDPDSPKYMIKGFGRNDHGQLGVETNLRSSIESVTILESAGLPVSIF